jgi:hypothetical protein
MTLIAKNHASYNPAYHLSYKVHGVSHSLILKNGAPIMIMQHYKTNSGKILRNGTLGTVIHQTEDSVHVEVTSNNGLKQQFEIKQVPIGNTKWHQFPLHVAYAGTIAKCIGFEFESIAIDFGIENDADCLAPWRQKQAYTAISRAKQSCYFIGKAPVALLNNMDMNALRFFNHQTLSYQRQAKNMTVARNIFEMREFWVRNWVSRRNKRAQRDFSCQEEDLQMITSHQSRLVNPIKGKTVADNKEITIYANTYPCCKQIMFGLGHILAATSQHHKQLLLKRYQNNSFADTRRNHEICILNTCKDVLGVLKLVATVDSGIVLEAMAGKVSWKDFAEQSTLQAKHAFSENFSKVLNDLREKQVAHGNINNRTAWIDMSGNVKLTWFQDAECPATDESMTKDIANVEKLCKSLFANAELGLNGTGNSDIGQHQSVSTSPLSISDEERRDSSGNDGSGELNAARA